MPSHLKDVFSFIFEIKLSCNTGPSESCSTGPSKGCNTGPSLQTLWWDRTEEITHSPDTFKCMFSPPPAAVPLPLKKHYWSEKHVCSPWLVKGWGLNPQQQTEVQTGSSVSPMQVSAVAAPALLTHGLRPESPLLLTNDHFLRSLLPQGVPDGLPAERAAVHPPCVCTSGGCPHPPPSLPGLSHL